MPADSVIHTAQIKVPFRGSSRNREDWFARGLARKALIPLSLSPVCVCVYVSVDSRRLYADSHRRLLPAFNHVTSVRHSDNPIEVTRRAQLGGYTLYSVGLEVSSRSIISDYLSTHDCTRVHRRLSTNRVLKFLHTPWARLRPSDQRR